MNGGDLFTGVAAAEVAATATLTGYGVAMFQVALPRAARWVTMLVAILLGQGASLLVLLMQTHVITPEHLSVHVTVGIIGTAAAVGLRGTHNIIEGRRIIAAANEEPICECTRAKDE